MNPRRPVPQVVFNGKSPAAIPTTRSLSTIPDWFWALLVIALGSAWFARVSLPVIVQAELALGRADFGSARLVATQELRTHARSDRALVVAGSASMAMQDISSAQAYFQRVSSNDPRLDSMAQQYLGRIALNAGHVLRAEELLLKSLHIVPNDAAVQDQLIYLLTLEGRGWEARALALDRLRSGVVTANYLMIVSRHDRSLEMASQYAQRCLAAVPTEPLPRLALAQQAWRDNQTQLAKELLRPVIEKHPGLLEAHALLGQIAAETGTQEEFDQACDRLPPTAQSHPDIWVNRGIAAEKWGRAEGAARCYWEALLLNPNLAGANYRLSQSLVSLGHPEQACPFAERAQKLTKLTLEMSSLSGKSNVEILPSIVSQLESLGRHWEAAGWCHTLLQETNLQPAWARATQARLYGSLTSSSSVTVASHDPARKIDLSRYPLPTRHRDSPPLAPSQLNTPSTRIAFRDDSARLELNFTYLNGAGQGDLESMLEMNGGGIAVLDYDGDHWPDVFFTQGGNLPPAHFDPSCCDQLFRNSGASDGPPVNQPFVNVTNAAGLRDAGFGQGVTVGDFDNDGFPDLYVGNIGTNQLYRNNGDGTFTDATTSSGTQAGGWTSSCVLADFNQDGLPDLYVVTYLGGGNIFQPCNKRVRPRCSPLNYVAEPDRFYLNAGDGRFTDMTANHGLVAPEGRGLGVVAADFDDSRRLSLFVANDMTPNFFFINRTTSPDSIQFDEQALLSGLALDHRGQAKACMGIAAGDFNQDGLLDLFVTNFYRQSNDLYMQEPDHSFRDLSREAKLFDPSFAMLGWGTQSLDADLDGLPDLVVTNGHVHDPVDAKIPYRMPPQFFRNLSGGKFAEVPADQLGEFFQQKLLGRSLARLDWNRDGREDICISHLNDPVTLLTNRTDRPGNFLSLQLIAVNSARDAIGTKVRVTTGAKVTTQQLTAGDGFHASNERQLVFGFGSSTFADSVEVTWPSGLRQEFPHLDFNQKWLLIEQRSPQAISTAQQ